LRAQRATIQSRATVSPDDIDAMLMPAPWPWQEYRELQRLQAIMHQRTTAFKE
jgi:hypothetical protein